MYGVEALGGSSKKFGSWASAAGGAVELLGLAKKEPVVLAMMEEGQVLMAVLRLEEGVGQVVKMVPPSSFS